MPPLPRRTFLALALVAAAFPARAAGAAPPVTVYAAASLREAFDAAAPVFTRRTGYRVRFSYGGSDTLATQLLAGAPADVFASANEAQMRRVAALVEAPRTLARNRLVVIAATNGPVRALADLRRPGTSVVLAASAVPVGAYARAALAKLGAAFAAGVARNVVSEETDVKAVATKVALGEADAGIVYATDVTPAVAPHVRVLAFPPGVAPEARYPIAVLREGPNAAGGRAFLRFITSAAGRAALRARGFAT